MEERLTSDRVCLECARTKGRNLSDNAKKVAAARKKKDRETNKDKHVARERKYKEENRDLIRDRAKERYSENKESERVRMREYYKENKEICIASTKRWMSRNEGYSAKYALERKKVDPEFKLYGLLRGMVVRVSRLGLKNKKSSYESILGYDRIELRNHLESQFQDGMSWDNHGEWHIDHIIPVSHFIKKGIYDPEKINALENLQPLWAEDNLKKGAKHF